MSVRIIWYLVLIALSGSAVQCLAEPPRRLWIRLDRPVLLKAARVVVPEKQAKKGTFALVPVDSKIPVENIPARVRSRGWGGVILLSKAGSLPSKLPKNADSVVWITDLPGEKQLFGLREAATVIVSSSSDYQKLDQLLSDFKRAGLEDRGIPALELSKLWSIRELEERFRFIRTNYPDCPGVALDARGAKLELVHGADTLMSRYFTGVVLSAKQPILKLNKDRLSIEISVVNIGDASSKPVSVTLDGIEKTSRIEKTGSIRPGKEQSVHFDGIPVGDNTDSVIKLVIECSGATIIRQPSAIRLKRSTDNG